jgi:hypothetical protein
LTEARKESRWRRTERFAPRHAVVPELKNPLGLFLCERFAANHPKIAREFLKIIEPPVFKEVVKARPVKLLITPEVGESEPL